MTAAFGGVFFGGIFKEAFRAWVRLVGARVVEGGSDEPSASHVPAYGCRAAAVDHRNLPPRYAADVAPIATSTSIAPGLKVDEIVARMEERNQQRSASLRGYEGKRSYSLSYRGFPGDREAEMDVVAHYESPANKSFDVVSGSGSKWIQSKVLLRLLEGEREAAHAENQRKTALTPDNYKFTLLGSRPSPYGGCYRVAVQPRRENKFLYRGEICVNAVDFAVESIDAEPAKNPSFWIKKTRIEHRYEKIGQFWLPASNESVSNVRLGGVATLKIVYSGYELRRAERGDSSASGRFKGFSDRYGPTIDPLVADRAKKGRGSVLRPFAVLQS